MPNHKKYTETGGENAMQHFKRVLPSALVIARYLLPVLSLLVLLVMSCLYTVRGAMLGERYEISLIRLYGNTFSGTHRYLSTDGTSAGNTLYAALSIGAIVGVLCFLIAAFLTVLAAVTALRAFRAGHASEESNRMKLIFKVAFPNRICLFLSNLLLLVPAAFPHYYSYIGSRYVTVGGNAILYVIRNRPLIVLAVLAALTLLLALIIPRYERARHMNMFLVTREEPDDEE